MKGWSIGECTRQGILEAIVNLLKADRFRKLVWQFEGVEACILDVPTTSPQLLYKSMFALWMLSFSPEGILSLNEAVLIKIIKNSTHCRVEKVVRLSLTVLRNFLAHKKFAEQVVEVGMLERVQQLEYEKWRDADLYDDIRDMILQLP